MKAMRSACVGLAVVALAFPVAAGTTGPAIHQPVIEDGGSGSTSCVNLPSFRYYLCVRSDGSVYRIYY